VSSCNQPFSKQDAICCASNVSPSNLSKQDIFVTANKRLCTIFETRHWNQPQVYSSVLKSPLRIKSSSEKKLPSKQMLRINLEPSQTE